MTLMEYLIQHYPSADPLHDFSVLDQGNGQFIGAWRLNAPRPTKAELTAAGITEGKKQMTTAEEAAAQRWEANIRDLFETEGRNIVQKAMAIALDADADGIAEIINDSEDGAAVPGTTIFKEDALLYELFVLDLQQFLQGQATHAPAGMTRQRLILRKVPRV